MAAGYNSDHKFTCHSKLDNLPYGVFKPSPREEARAGVAIGDYVLDLSAICRAGLFNGPLLKGSHCFLEGTLNAFMAMGRPAWKEARATIQKLLSADDPTLRDNAELRRKALLLMNQVQMVLPAVIGDYTDFFSSKHHTQNCLAILFGPEAPIPPNWLSLPVAYHGRASSVVISGTDIVRPRGQLHPAGKPLPGFGPSAKLDFELEMAAIVGPGNDLGRTVNVDDASDHIFGLVLMNDWSARDIQAWESIPLGPFLGKSFGTSISPWIVTLEALEPFACEAQVQDPPPLPYLAAKSSHSYDIPLEVSIKPAGEDKTFVVSRSNFNHLYWTLEQQIAHHTINGCNLRSGDLLGSGTISGPNPENLGSLLELTCDGKKQLKIGNNLNRTFLGDGDEVILTACCQGDGYKVGFGACSGKVLPANL
ncbi:fumarylacetoacetase isoform X1 [Cryptomeria japonica]|uniref:fumarylacetoacetase isoform X1 n=1 Tax=Cryptomeria japonica TaxID=3369 RepID=UPI0025AD454E|nr:fumarylacetoacetase isoform X1 [Cryptomeria japonica]